MSAQCIFHLRRLYYRIRIYQKIKKFETFKNNLYRKKYGLPEIKSCLTNTIDLIREPISHFISIVWHFITSIIWSVFPEKTNPLSQTRNLLKSGTKEQKLLRRVVLFALGLSLSWTAFYFIHHMLTVSRIATIIWSLIILFVLTLTAPFFDSILCVILLMLPILLSSKTRFIIVAYIFLMIYSEIIPNIKTNGVILIATLKCGNDLADTGKDAYNSLKEYIGGFVNSIVQPIIEIKNNIEETLKNLREMINEWKIKLQFMTIKLQNLCKVPSDNSINKCDKKLSFQSFFGQIHIPGLCAGLFQVFSALCQGIKNQFKELGEKIAKRVNEVIEEVKEKFAFNYTLNHNFEYSTNETKDFKQIITDIRDDFQDKYYYFENLSFLLDFQNLILIVITGWVLFGAIRYRCKYLKCESFDNYYINKEFIKIDKKRNDLKKETVLPLRPNEKSHYIDPMDLQMTFSERIKLLIGLFMFTIALSQTAMLISIDYVLYKLMDFISQMMVNLSQLLSQSIVKINTNSDTLVGNSLNRFIDFQKNASDVMINCRPLTQTPDFELYVKLGIYLCITFITIFTESYGLRARHCICGLFHPKQVPLRAVWLYNNILCTRGDFIQNIRRSLRKDVQQNEEMVSFLDNICAKYTCIRVVCKMFGLYGSHKNCLVCGIKIDVEEFDKYFQCPNDCPGIYCRNCFDDINNLCTLCMNPIEYGESEDVSEEHDSSDEDIFYFPSAKDYSYQYRRDSHEMSDESSINSIISQNQKSKSKSKRAVNDVNDRNSELEYDSEEENEYSKLLNK